MFALSTKKWWKFWQNIIDSIQQKTFERRNNICPKSIRVFVIHNVTFSMTKMEIRFSMLLIS